MANLLLVLSSVSVINYDPLISQITETLHPIFEVNQWLSLNLQYDQHVTDNALVVALLKGLQGNYIPSASGFDQYAGAQQLLLTVDIDCHQYVCQDSLTIKFNGTTSTRYLIDWKNDELSVQVTDSYIEPRKTTIFLWNDLWSFVGPDSSGNIIIFGRAKAIFKDLKQFLPIELSIATSFSSSFNANDMIRSFQFPTMRAELLSPAPSQVYSKMDDIR